MGFEVHEDENRKKTIDYITYAKDEQCVQGAESGQLTARGCSVLIAEQDAARGSCKNLVVHENPTETDCLCAPTAENQNLQNGCSFVARNTIRSQS